VCCVPAVCFGAVPFESILDTLRAREKGCTLRKDGLDGGRRNTVVLEVDESSRLKSSQDLKRCFTPLGGSAVEEE
jgi:hypothetical protein